MHNRVIRISYAIMIGLPVILDLIGETNQAFSVSPNIFLIFYSAIFLIIIYLIFSLAAPKEIKEYQKIMDYVQDHNASLLISYVDKKKEIVTPHLAEGQTQTKSRILELDKSIREEENLLNKKRLEIELNELLTEVYPGCVDNYLKKEWDFVNKKRNRGALIACYLLFSFAAVLALWVVTYRTYLVVKYQIQMP
jgi:hypothetical protein